MSENTVKRQAFSPSPQSREVNRDFAGFLRSRGWRSRPPPLPCI